MGYDKKRFKPEMQKIREITGAASIAESLQIAISILSTDENQKAIRIRREVKERMVERSNRARDLLLGKGE